MPNSSYELIFEHKRFITGALAAGVMYFFFGPAPLVGIAIVFVLKKNLEQKSINKLIQCAIKAENSLAFFELERRKINLSNA